MPPNRLVAAGYRYREKGIRPDYWILRRAPKGTSNRPRDRLPFPGALSAPRPTNCSGALLSALVPGELLGSSSGRPPAYRLIAGEGSLSWTCARGGPDR